MKRMVRTISPLLFTLLGFTTVANAQISIPATGVINTIAGDGASGSSGDGGAATSAEVEPTDVAIDGMGNIYIADYFGNQIRKITQSTGVITLRVSSRLSPEQELLAIRATAARLPVLS